MLFQREKKRDSLIFHQHDNRLFPFQRLSWMTSSVLLYISLMVSIILWDTIVINSRSVAFTGHVWMLHSHSLFGSGHTQVEPDVDSGLELSVNRICSWKNQSSLSICRKQTLLFSLIRCDLAFLCNSKWFWYYKIDKIPLIYNLTRQQSDRTPFNTVRVLSLSIYPPPRTFYRHRASAIFCYFPVWLSVCPFSRPFSVIV